MTIKQIHEELQFFRTEAYQAWYKTLSNSEKREEIDRRLSRNRFRERVLEEIKFLDMHDFFELEIYLDTNGFTTL